MNTAPGGHFFLAQSSLHFILAAAMAEEVRGSGGRPTLVFLPDVLDPDLFRQAADAWPDSPFERIVFITPRKAPTRAAAGKPSWGRLKRDLLHVLHQVRPVAVTVFNDKQDPNQLVLAQAARHFPQALRECVEDGAVAYTSFTYRQNSLYTRLRQRLRLGPGWHNVRVLGTHPLVQQFTAMHPQLLRSELRQRNVRPFPAHQLDTPPLRHLAGVLCAGAGFDASMLGSGAVLIILSHSDYARRNPQYVQLVRACVQRLQQQSMPFFFKFHPRETEPEFAGIEATAPGRELPRTLPVECIFLLARELPLLVVAGMSTSLLTGGLLMQRARIAALMHDSQTGESWDTGLLKALNIQPLYEADQLSACVDTWRETTTC